VEGNLPRFLPHVAAVDRALNIMQMSSLAVIVIRTRCHAQLFNLFRTFACAVRFPGQPGQPSAPEKDSVG